ncbi:hypothetical protein [Amycolatopsis balhimycina]|nr:hypothetical protein [Amycolatopsis balhimycina]
MGEPLASATMDGKLIDRIRGAKRIAALTGAGISTAAGIPATAGS